MRTFERMKNASTTSPLTAGTQNLDESLSSLLGAWTTHDDLRRRGADIADLAASNERLVTTRLAVRSAVRSI